MRYEITEDSKVSILTFNDLAGKKAFWHTTSHIMAQAVQRLFPGVKFAIGPAIDNGFYYDFDVENPFTDEDKANIEAEMKKIIKERNHTRLTGRTRCRAAVGRRRSRGGRWKGA